MCEHIKIVCEKTCECQSSQFYDLLLVLLFIWAVLFTVVILVGLLLMVSSSIEDYYKEKSDHLRRKEKAKNYQNPKKAEK